MRKILSAFGLLIGLASCGPVAADSFNTLDATATTISGGTIDNAVIGGTTPAAATVTSLTATGLLTFSGTEDNITAFAGGGQASATALSATKNFHRVTTVASLGDSVKLPAATAGQIHYVVNSSANSMRVFGTGSETINSIASGTGVLLQGRQAAFFVSTADGKWTTTFRRINGTNNQVTVTVATDGEHTLSTPQDIGTASSVTFGAARVNGQVQLGTTSVNHYLGIGTGWLWTSDGLSGGTLNGGIYASSSTLRLFGGTSITPIVTVSSTGASVTGTWSVASGAAANQPRYTQTTPPTCSSNCGTSPSVTGSDTSMTVTMGASGSPASGWVITFNGTWAAAPQCVGQMALAGMAATKMPIVIATTTTTATVTTNGVAPANSDKYHIVCTLGS